LVPDDSWPRRSYPLFLARGALEREARHRPSPL